jgi:hypothetical protein
LIPLEEEEGKGGIDGGREEEGEVGNDRGRDKEIEREKGRENRRLMVG